MMILAPSPRRPLPAGNFAQAHLRALRGLGDVCVPTDFDYDPALCADAGGADPGTLPVYGGGAPAITLTPTPVSTGSSSTGLTPAQIAALITTGGAAATNVIRAAQGQTVTLPAGSRTTASVGVTGSGLTASIGSGLIPLLMLAIVAGAFAFSRKG